LDKDLSKFIFSKETPKGAWILLHPDRIEVGAYKKDYEYMGLQLFVASPFIFYFFYNVFNLNPVHIFISLVILSLFAWWININLSGKIKVEISRESITVYDGLNAKELICRILVSEIAKIELGSKGIAKEYMSGAGVKSLNAKKIEIEIKTKNKSSYFFGATTKNIYKSYIKYILNEYLNQR
jgi:hypothetical protein